MKASFENDPVRGPGYGFIRLSELDIPETAPLFSLRRSGDQLCMAVSDWQEAEERLKPDSFHFENGALLLSVSPLVVDRLDPLQIYRLTLFGGAESQRCSLELHHVCYSPLAPGCSVAEVPPAPVVPTAQVAPVTPEAPAPLPEPKTPEAPLDMSAAESSGQRNASFGPWLIVAGLLVCLAIGGGVWWYMDSRRATQTELLEKAEQDKVTAEKDAAEKAATEKSAMEKAEVEKAAADKQAVEKLAQEKVATAEKEAAEKAATEKETAEKLAQAETEKVAARSAKEQVRDFLRGSGTPADALALSKQLPTASVDDQDALFLLMEAAADGGNAEAMLTVARFYNPADASPSGTIIKDAEQAFIWFGKAKATPETSAEAAKGLASLREWLQARVATDPAAKTLLDRMEK